MRWPHWRLTTRKIMLLVLIIGIMLHLGVTAWRVASSRRTHLHTGFMGGGDHLGFMIVHRREAFWPVFWRQSIGMRPHGLGLCAVGGNVLEELCELDHPEIRRTLSPTSYSAIQTQTQIDAFVKLAGEKGYTVHYGSEYVSATRKGRPR